MAEGLPAYVDAVRATSSAPEGSQAALSFGVHVALAALWRAWGIDLGAIVGTGAGEVAAAHASGLFSLEDAARQIAATRAAFGDDADLASRTHRLITAGHDTFLDAHGVLRVKLRDALAAGNARLVAGSSNDVRERLLVALADLYVNGASIAWRRVAPEGGRRVALPTYPWQRRRYWLDDSAAKKPHDAHHPLIGPAQTIAGQPRLVVCEATIDPARVAYLAAHRVAGDLRMPAGAFIEMIAAAARHKHRSAAVTLDDIVLHDPLPITADIVAQVVVTADAADRVSVEVASHDGESTTWRMHATARAFVGTSLAGVSTVPEEVQARCESTAAAAYYEQLAARRLSCGDALRPLDAIWSGDGEVLGRVRLASDTAGGASFYVVHPLVLEACFQLAVGAVAGEAGPLVPASIERIAIHRRAETDGPLYAHVRRREGALVDACVVDGSGRAIVELHGLSMEPMDAARREPANRADVAPASVRA
jgi:acyl transferase domain-containing protein